LDGEAGGAEGRRKESGALGFFVADLGVAPDLPRDVFVGLARGVVLGGVLGLGFLRGGGGGGEEEAES
jgi:hypothetical protein